MKKIEIIVIDAETQEKKEVKTALTESEYHILGIVMPKIQSLFSVLFPKESAHN